MGIPNFLRHSPPPQKRNAAAVFRHLPVLLAVLVVAAGCSDDSGGGGSGGGGSTGAELEAFFADLSADTDVTSAETAAAAAATPATHSMNGGLTQSSDTNNPVIHVEIGGSEGSRIYTITNAPESGTAAHTLSLGNDDITDPEGNIVRFVKEEPAGNTYLYLNADAVPDAGGVNDYLAYGFWIHDPDNALNDPPLAPTVGVFIDSSSTLAFEGSHVVGLTGEAQYAGSAEGLYYSTPQEGDPEFLSFIARVALTADFGSVASPGEISGTVDNFMTGNQGVDALLGLVEITLDTAALTDGSTTFAGLTSATVTIEENEVPFAGQWGGQFLWDTDNSTTENPPGLAAGTFGLADPLGVRTLLGVFHTTLQQP